MASKRMTYGGRRMAKRATRQVTGLILRWSDPDPLTHQSEPVPTEVTHRNPVMRLCAKEIFRDYLEWITQKQAFRWLIKITVVFKYDNGVDQNETVEMEAVAVMANLNDIAIAQIEEAMRAGNSEKYSHTEFEIECLGA